MKVLDSEFCKGFIKLADNGNSRGWHERNGGNLSYRIHKKEIESVWNNLNFSTEYNEIGAEVPSLAGEFFMVTGSGKFFCNIKENVEENCCIIEIDMTGTKYRIVWGLTKGANPTSELPSHLMNHQVKKIASENRVIYHCHPPNIIAMTFVLPLCDDVFSRELWEMMTECPIIFPAGVGVIPWMVPGGREIAEYTSEKLKKYDVAIWAHHGIFCSGTDFENTYGLAETIEKSAGIFVKVRSMSDNKLQTIKKDDFIRLAKAFGVVLTEDFLK